MAEEAIFHAKTRDRAGKGAARAVRREGLVPGVVYGDHKDPQTIAVDPRVIMKQLELGVLFNTIYTIEVDGGKNEKALPRDVQFHPVTDAPLHIDFMRLTKGAKINVMVPVHFENEDKCEALKQGGILSVTRDEVELIAPADNIPHAVSCDLTGLEIGDTIRISMVQLPAGVTPAITDRDFVVANIASPVVSEPADSDEDEAEGEGEDEGDSEE